jgi:hypothetical protein
MRRVRAALQQTPFVRSRNTDDIGIAEKSILKRQIGSRTIPMGTVVRIARDLLEEPEATRRLCMTEQIALTITEIRTHTYAIVSAFEKEQ